MTITRTTVADEIDRLDVEIAELQKDKAEIYHAWREHLEDEGKAKVNITAEVAALKAAIKRRRAMITDPALVEEKDALLDEILTEIRSKAKTGTIPALARHTRTRAPRETAPVEPTPAIASPVSGPSLAEPTGTVPRPEDRDPPDGGGELTEGIPPFLARDKDNRVPDTRP